MTTISAEIIADSVSDYHPRLTTILTRYPRWIHAEGRTHRRLSLGEGLEFEQTTPSPMADPNLSRNASSSRAIPVEKLIKEVIDDPAVPLFWGRNQRGMQADEEWDAEVNLFDPETGGDAYLDREKAWLWARNEAVIAAKGFAEAGYHKQIVNRLLEPFSHINVLWTGVKWTNFFGLRLHEDAEPHMRLLAQRMKAAMDASTPKLIRPGEWHLPFVRESDRQLIAHHYRGVGPTYKAKFVDDDLVKLSVARCASLSYRTVDGQLMTAERAIALYDKLLDAQPIHASPAEHQAKADEQHGDETGGYWVNERLSGNLGAGWIQFRKTLPNEEIL